MKSGAVPICAWGLFIACVSVLGAVAFGLDVLPTLLLAGAGTACVLTGLAYGIVARRGPRRAARRELLVDGSATTTVATVGFSLAVVGAVAAGPAFFWPGVGLFILGAGGVVRELRAGRALLREERP